jgi:hypothetical protein
VEYLDRDHQAFRDLPARLAQAEHAVLLHSLHPATRYRMEFDSDRLRSLLGETTFSKLATGFRAAGRKSQYDIHEDQLDEERASLLLSLISPLQQGDRESARNYIRSLRLLDDAGRTLFRSSDHHTFVLFDLPDDERQALAATLDEVGLPADTMQPIDVPVDRLRP